MRNAGGAKPFESAASERVDESEHPIEQLQLLDAKVAELQGQSDSDGVIECRIKQLALHRLLQSLYDFPTQEVIRAEVLLAEAYAVGEYFKQAHQHLEKARSLCAGDVFDDVQCQRLQVDILLAEGVVQVAEKQPDKAGRTLTDAARLTRETYGEMDLRNARIQVLLGKLAQESGRLEDAVDHFQRAWEVHECVDGGDAEETLRMRVQVAELQYANGDLEGMEDLCLVAQKLRTLGTFPMLLVDCSGTLARWLEAQGRDTDALQVLEGAEAAANSAMDAEDTKAVDIKRDMALLHLKRGDHDAALRYLNDVHYYERRLHGSQSTNVARTLKALGTVHLVRRNMAAAEQCFQQALRIFEADYPPNQAMIKDLHAKLVAATLPT